MAFTLLPEDTPKAPSKGKFVILDEADPIKSAIDRSGSAAAVDTALSLGSGAVAGPLAGLAGIAGAVLPGPAGQGADWVHKTQDALTYEPRTAVGKGLTQAVSYPFQKLADVADAAGAKVTDRTGSPAIGAASNALLQSVPLALGRFGRAGESGEAVSKRAALKAQNAQIDAGVTAAKDAGYVLPPTQANPSLWNQIAEGFAGKIKTAQSASELNQPVTNRLVRQALGVSEDAPLNAATLNQVRKTAGEAYQDVRGTGRVAADPVYFETLDSIAAPFERASKDFPSSARADIIDAVKGAKIDSFDASSAVDQIKIFREKADQAYGSKDKTLGKAYKDIAGALEEQLGRHLESSGASGEALQKFRDARETIAKTYTVEKHLQPNGNVDARGLGADLKRKPLTAELRTAAEFGKNFPKAAQLPEKIGGVPMSPWDHAMGIGGVAGAVLSGQPAVALAGLAPYGRVATRSAILSKMFQDQFVTPRSYETPAAARLKSILGETQSPEWATMEMSQGQRN